MSSQLSSTIKGGKGLFGRRKREPDTVQEETFYRAGQWQLVWWKFRRHRLAQIATDGWQKVPIRILPVLRHHLARGDVPLGATRVLAAWTEHLRGSGGPVDDPAAVTRSSATLAELRA